MLTDLEVQDDGPYQSQGKLRVAVDDILCPDVDELDLLVPEKVECHLDVLQHVESHPASLARLETKINETDKKDINFECTV